VKECPACKGSGGCERDPNPYWLTDMEFVEPVEWNICGTCEGKGEITPLAHACYVAGGGQPPTEMKGYA